MHKFAINFDVIARARLYAEVFAHFAVYGNSTRRDQLIAMSARSDSSGREETIQAHGALGALKRFPSAVQAFT